MRSLIRTIVLAATCPAIAVAQPVEIPAIDSNASASANGRGAAAQATFSAVPSDHGQFGAGTSASDVPRTMPPPLPALSPDKPLTHRQSVVVAQAARWRQRAARAQVDDTGWVHFAFGDGEPFVVCAPLHICDIKLQAGERVLEAPDLSDPRWVVHARYAIEGGESVTHVIVKPADDGLDGNIVLHTDRRTYSIGLISRDHEYMPLVAFDYPDDGRTAQEWTAPAPPSAVAGADPCDGVPVVPPPAFKISGPKRPWTPLEAFVVATPVGEKTCIAFASDIGSRALPAIVSLGHDGTWFSDPTPQIVNVRYVKRHFIVDEAMDRFALISGVGDSQEKNEIQRIGP